MNFHLPSLAILHLYRPSLSGHNYWVCIYYCTNHALCFECEQPGYTLKFKYNIFIKKNQYNGL